MNKGEVVLFLKKSIKAFSTKVLFHPSDAEGNIKRSISIIILKGFLKFVEKEEDFILNINNKKFAESLLETIDIVSTENAYKIIDRARFEESMGLNILKDEIEKYRKENKGEDKNAGDNN